MVNTIMSARFRAAFSDFWSLFLIEFQCRMRFREILKRSVVVSCGRVFTLTLAHSWSRLGPFWEALEKW